MVKATKKELATGSLSALVGGNVKRRRQELGITQSQLAQVLGVEVETVSRYERGTVAPSFPQLEKICVALEVAAWSLFSDGAEVPNSDGGTLAGMLDTLSSADREFVVAFVKSYVEHHKSGKR